MASGEGAVTDGHAALRALHPAPQVGQPQRRQPSWNAVFSCPAQGADGVACPDSFIRESQDDRHEPRGRPLPRCCVGIGEHQGLVRNPVDENTPRSGNSLPSPPRITMRGASISVGSPDSCFVIPRSKASLQPNLGDRSDPTRSQAVCRRPDQSADPSGVGPGIRPERGGPFVSSSRGSALAADAETAMTQVNRLVVRLLTATPSGNRAPCI